MGWGKKGGKVEKRGQSPSNNEAHGTSVMPARKTQTNVGKANVHDTKKKKKTRSKGATLEDGRSGRMRCKNQLQETRHETSEGETMNMSASDTKPWLIRKSSKWIGQKEKRKKHIKSRTADSIRRAESNGEHTHKASLWNRCDVAVKQKTANWSQPKAWVTSDQSKHCATKCWTTKSRTKRANWVAYLRPPGIETRSEHLLRMVRPDDPSADRTGQRCAIVWAELFRVQQSDRAKVNEKRRKEKRNG